MGWSAGSAIPARPVCFPTYCLSTHEDTVCVGQGPVREVEPVSIEVDLDVDTVLEEEMEGEGEMDMEMEGEGEMDTVMEMEASLSRAFDLTQGWALIKASLQEADHPEGRQHGGRTEPTPSVASDLGTMRVLRICRSSRT